VYGFLRLRLPMLVGYLSRFGFTLALGFRSQAWRFGSSVGCFVIGMVLHKMWFLVSAGLTADFWLPPTFTMWKKASVLLMMAAAFACVNFRVLFLLIGPYVGPNDFYFLCFGSRNLNFFVLLLIGPVQLVSFSLTCWIYPTYKLVPIF
jgi:hypothetical protein